MLARPMPEPDTSRPPPSAGNRFLPAVLLSLALAGLVGFLYAPVHDFAFVSLDDPYYIQQNPNVQGGLTWENVSWSFTHARVRNWHPLTWISHMIDVELFGDDAGGHHLMNVAIQMACVVLLLWFLWAATGALWRSAAVTALFAAHPLRVESVAWVTERKDLLAAFFFLCTLLVWLRYARRPNATRYAWVLVAFTLTLLCKSTPITLPALLLLLDVWPLRRVRFAWARPAADEPPGPAPCPTRSVGWLLVEKLPLVGLSIGSAVMTLWAAGESATTSASIPSLNKLATPAIGTVEYLRKTVWPDDLACFYPLPPGYADGVLEPWVTRAGFLYGGLALLTVGVLVLSFGRRRKAYLAVGWFWFVGMLVPASGFVQVGSQLLADRYSYLPHMGLLVAIVWSASDLLGGERGGRARAGRVVGALLLLACVGALSVATREQVQTWRNSYRMFEQAVRVTEDNYFAHQGLGAVLARRGERERAEEHLRAALTINPTFVPAYTSLAELLLDAPEGGTVAPDPDTVPGSDAAPDPAAVREAEELLRQAIAVDAGSFEATYDLGRLLADEGRFEPALELLRRARELRPASLECAALLGRLEVEHGDLGAGITVLKSVLDRQPEHAPSREALRDARRRRKAR